MINKRLLFLSFLFARLPAFAGVLPIDTLRSNDASKPLVFYITGDGGFNSFSTTLMQQWNAKGYAILALNAKSYFWKAKQPNTAAADIAALLSEYMNKWHRNEVILAGYSFGADVLSFIQTRLPASIAGKVTHTVLVSPSGSTDFTIHLFYSSGGNSVPEEINKLNKSVLVLFGKQETNTPANQIKNKLATVITLPGDHHYDNQIALVTNEIVKRM